jgi:hypothetical protein
MEKKSAMKIESILAVDIDDLGDVVGGKNHVNKSVHQSATVTQDGSVVIRINGAGNLSSFFCPGGDDNQIHIGSTQNATVTQRAE